MKIIIYIVLATLIMLAANCWGALDGSKAYWTGFLVATALDIAWNVGKAFDKD